MTATASAATLFFDVGDLVMIRVRDTTDLHESVPTRGTGYITQLRDTDLDGENLGEWIEVRVLGTDCPHIYRPEELIRLAGGAS